MIELLAGLHDTPVPNVLVIAGIVFLVLAIAGRVGAHLSIPPKRQSIAAAIGITLLASGIGLFLVPSDGPQAPGQVGVTSVEPSPRFKPTQEADKTPTIDYAEMRAGVVATIKTAVAREILAKKYLNPADLETVYAGTSLKTVLATLDNIKRKGEVELCEVTARQFHSIDIAVGAGRATVDMTESWDCASYSAENRECLRQQASVQDLRQTVFLERQGSNWLITTVDFGDAPVRNPGVPCSDRWPAKLSN